MRSITWRLWVHDGIPDRAHVDRQPRASHLRRQQRNPERVDCLVPVRNSSMKKESVIDERLQPEHRSLVIEYNNSAAPYPSEKTIVDLFVEQVARTPHDEAIRLGNESLTYRELNHRANQMAAHLRALGVAPGELVMIFMEHSIEVVAAILGVLKAGAAYVPVDPHSPKDRLALILQDMKDGLGGAMPALVTQSQLAGRLPSNASRVV